ncbi:MAG: 4-(cytidine 5'-diphospho)-2-C-methyl-D-erythritol kinase [Proteobacteria bacterium]|nr:4-(cytidine 5'-diphospho)-2-C-methyl-D-erythritol kinase [Pseudomonadota bacterium]
MTEHAPAKINLYLHVLGKRSDGYHLLDSLVVFAAPGSAAADRVELSEAAAYSLKIEGPQALGLKQEDAEKNLVTKALRALAAKVQKPLNIAVTLHKNLPLASGIGGGSADAGAALRAAAKFWHLEKDHPAISEAARETGADVYPCLSGTPCYLDGTGHDTAPALKQPRAFLVLINPYIPLPTAAVFALLQGPFSPPARFEKRFATVEEFAAALALRRNDLQAVAIQLCGAIENVLAMLEDQPGCLLARMSGAGATCFGLFAQEPEARHAAEKIRRQIREYWVAVTGIG